MKVIGKTINNSETSVSIDLFEGRKLKPAVKKAIQEEVGNYLVEQTLVSMNEQKSPVQGEGSFKALSKDYKKKKLQEVGSSEANLEFYGDMKDELDFVPTKTGIEIGVYGERAPAADGHNNLSGKSQIPTRRFLPDEGQSYKSNITKEIDRIIADVVAENAEFKKFQFKNVTNKKEMYEVLKKIFGNMSRGELAIAVFRNEELTDLLKELDLLEYV